MLNYIERDDRPLRSDGQLVTGLLKQRFQPCFFVAQKLNEKQAIVALQTGLSLLNKNRKNCIIEAKNALKEDGLYGEKTKASLYEACKNNNSRVIKKYILKGVLNNIIFTTKNEAKIDTKKLLHDTKLSLEEKI